MRPVLTHRLASFDDSQHAVLLIYMLHQFAHGGTISVPTDSAAPGTRKRVTCTTGGPAEYNTADHLRRESRLCDRTCSNRHTESSAHGLCGHKPALHHPPDRGRPPPAVRPAPGRPRPSLHHRDLHLRLLRLPHPLPATRPGRHHRGRSAAVKDLLMPRQVSYRWRLRELMAARGMFTVAELMPHLTERGITLSSSQVHRLVSETPERLSVPVPATLCDILDCTPTDLIATSAQNLPARRAAGEETLINLAARRPTRVRLTTRPPGPGPRHRESARLPRQDGHPSGHRGRRNLEPIRPRRPPAMKRGTHAGSAEPRLSSTWTT
ncbi:helix-turn-helix domain-containing protein [Streptomyces sp. NBC_00328]|uniref:helix-turn-helix domain-containing protein n=1 Tax=Streptomyces sp. NBC_00328 TaxID=2903646 RepID=UPI003FA75702